jgi:hypothetical protein
MTLRHLAISIFAVALSIALTLPAEAAPVLYGSHYYEFIQVTDPFTGDNNSWFRARDAAAAMTFGGVSGHLATVTSAGENDFLYSLVAGMFTGFRGAWLGGKHPEGWLVGPEAGSSFTYVSWGGIEPNNDGYAYMNIGTLFAGIGPGNWADDSGLQGFPDPSNDPVIGYFVEYEEVAGVPEPSAWLLLGFSLLLIECAFVIRKRGRAYAKVSGGRCDSNPAGRLRKR